jgi:hypothetical protein
MKNEGAQERDRRRRLYGAAMNPLNGDLLRSLHPGIENNSVMVHQPDIIPLWWALALGACPGGERHNYRCECERRDQGYRA